MKGSVSSENIIFLKVILWIEKKKKNKEKEPEGKTRQEQICV